MQSWNKFDTTEIMSRNQQCVRLCRLNVCDPEPEQSHGDSSLVWRQPYSSWRKVSKRILTKLKIHPGWYANGFGFDMNRWNAHVSRRWLWKSFHIGHHVRQRWARMGRANHSSGGSHFVCLNRGRIRQLKLVNDSIWDSAWCDDTNETSVV